MIKVNARAGRLPLVVAGLMLLAAPGATAQQVTLSEHLTPSEWRCLHELLGQKFPHGPADPTDISTLVASARVGRARLGRARGKAYLYLFEDIGWCGSAGCLLMIGEDRSGGHCRMLHEGSGDAGYIRVLRRRDHGYQRLYLPCEVRFDGREYQVLHEECPNANIAH